MTIRIAIILSIVATIGVLVIRVAFTPARTTHATRDYTVAHWNHLAVKVPHGWKQYSRNSDYVSWHSHDHKKTLTVGVVAAADEPLATLVAATDRSLQKLPGYTNSSFHGSKNQVRHMFNLTSSSGVKIRVMQIWKRLGDGRDSISTWTMPVNP